MKPKANDVVARAVELATGPTIRYDELDCQAFVEQCVRDCGGSMDYAGSNAMARSSPVWMGTIENAEAEGRIVPGAGLLIHEDDESRLPVKYQGDGLGDFSHVGLYVGPRTPMFVDSDKYGNGRQCDVVHSSSSMGRVAGSTLKNGWTHVIWFKEIDYGVEVEPGVQLGAAVEDEGLTAGAGESGGDGLASGMATIRYATVTSPDGNPVKLRKSANKLEPVYWKVNVGARVRVERTKGDWSLITAICTDGAQRRAYMMSKFLQG